MNILIDSQAFDAQQVGGVSNCWVKIIENIIKNKTNDIHIFLGAKGTYNYHLLESKLSKTLDKSPNNWKTINREYTLKLLKTKKFDLFIPTLYDNYFLNYLNNTPYIFIIHDIIAYVNLKYLNPSVSLYDNTIYNKDQDTDNRILLANKANKIIAISNKTKNDLIKYYNLNGNNIEVIYHGVNTTKCQYNKLLNYPYILYVGSRLGPLNYKCFIPFVNQISLFLQNHPKFKVVCTHIPFSNFEKELFHQYNIEDKFINIKPTDSELSSLYHYAFCHVFPSEYEGFGLPLLEAASNGCISLYNRNNECLNEISNNCFLNYNGRYITDLNNKLEYIYSFTDIERKNVLENQVKRINYFSWNTTAIQYINLFKSVCEANLNKDVNIYVCSHKEFNTSIIPTNANYIVLNSNDFKNDLYALEFGYAEGYHIYQIWKNIKPNCKYIGINHYRRYFDTVNFNNIEKYDIVLPNPISFGGQTLYEQYCKTGNKKDIDLIGDIIKDKYKDYYKDYITIMNRQYFYACNMFIIKTEEFNKYCEFAFNILQEYCNINKLYTYDDLINYTKNNKTFIGNMNTPGLDNYFTTVEYNSRQLGGILERLLNIYVEHNFKNIKTYPIKIIK